MIQYYGFHKPNKDSELHHALCLFVIIQLNALHYENMNKCMYHPKMWLFMFLKTQTGESEFVLL